MHFKYNMVCSAKEKNNEKISGQNQMEIDPEKKGTIIYSDGSAYVEDQKGKCAVIVNTNGKHFVAMRALAQYQGRNSYRTELEGIYLGTKVAGTSSSKDRQWNYWTDSDVSITQCEKKHLTTNDMVAQGWIFYCP